MEKIINKIYYQSNNGGTFRNETKAFCSLQRNCPAKKNNANIIIELEEIKKRYNEYTERFKNEFDKRIQTEDIPEGELVLIAKNWNEKDLKKIRCLDNLYYDDKFPFDKKFF